MANLSDGNLNLQFQQLEKNIIAFKGIFGILNTSTFTELLSNEKVAKSFNIFTDDILSGQINFASNNSDLAFDQSRTWSIVTGKPSIAISTGGPDTKVPDSTTAAPNPNIEKILIPLTKVKGTSNQLYVAYVPDSSYEGYEDSSFDTDFGADVFQLDKGTLAITQDKILKNFINPTKFGDAYKAVVYSSTEADEKGTSVTSGPVNLPAGNIVHGGWIFDYKDGALLFTVDSNNESPTLHGFRHPLWLEAYRYKGQTGLVGGINAISDTTETNFDFNSNTFDLTLGAQTVNLAGLGTSFEHLIFKNDFARHDIQFSSSIAIMHDADADGFPYVTSSYESWLMLHTIHLTDPNKNNFSSTDVTIAPEFQNGAPIIQFPYGFAIEFSSSLSPSKCPYFPNKHYNPIRLNSGHSQSILFDDVTDGQYQEHRAHTHGFNWGYVTQSNGNNFYYDPSNKTSGSIAEGLRDFINTSCSAHLTASVSIEASVDGNPNVPVLTVEQLYSGMPSWYYTNDRGGFKAEFFNEDFDLLTSESFKNYTGTFLTSSQGNETTGFGASIYPLRFTASNDVENIKYWPDGPKPDFSVSSVEFYQNTPQTGSEEHGNQLLKFQKSLFHLDEKLFTGSISEGNFFNTLSGSFINLFCGDFPDALTQFHAFGGSQKLFDGTGWEHLEGSTEKSVFASYLPGLIIGNSSVTVPDNTNGGPANFRVGSRTVHPWGLGNASLQGGQATTHGWGSGPWASTFRHNGLLQTQFGGILFPKTLPTGSDNRFGQGNNVFLKNGILSQRNPSRRTIIKSYQLEMLRGGFGGAQFGLVDFVDNNQHAVLQLNTSINSLSGSTVGSAGTLSEIPINKDFRETGNTSKNGLNYMWSSSISSSTEVVLGEEVTFSFPNEGDFASMNAVEFLSDQANASPTEVEIISDVSPDLGGNLNLNSSTINGIGNIDISGNIKSTTITANSVLSSSGDLHVAGNLDGNTFNFTGFSFEDVANLNSNNNITASGNISASGYIVGNDITSSNNVSASGNLISNNIITNNITASGNINASGLIIASASHAPTHTDSILAIVYDTSSGQFHYTGSYGSGGGGTGFPFSGSAVLTGSLIISNSSPFLQLDSSSTPYPGAGKLHNRGGDLFWGNTNVASVGSGITAISQDGSPSLGGDLTLGNNDVAGIDGASITLTGNSGTNELILSSSGITLAGNILQTGATSITQLTTTEITGSLSVTQNITSSIISASGIIVGSNLTGSNTGDQDLILFISSSETSSLVKNSETSSLVKNFETSSFVFNSETSSLVKNSETSSFVFNTSTSSFVFNSETSSLVKNSETSSFVFNSETSSLVKNSETSSFLVLSDTASFVINGTASLTNITASGEISASGDIKTSGNVYLELGRSTNFATHVGHFNGQLVGTNITTTFRDGSRDHTEVDSDYSISGSLIVSESSKFLNPVAIGTPYTPSTLNVSGNIFVSNMNDSSTPDNEGILIETSGEDNQTVNKIFFQKEAPFGSLNGIEFLHNGSTSTLNGIAPGTFSITQHNNSVNGESKFSIKSDGNIGIGKSSPSYGVHIGPSTFFDNNITLASGKTLTAGSSVRIGTDGIQANTIQSIINAPIEIGKFLTGAGTHIKDNLVVSQSATIARDLIVGGRIISKVGTSLLLGDKHKPVKELHVDQGTIFFYSGSTTEVSSSTEVAKLEIVEVDSTASFEFKSGSELAPIRTKELKIGTGTTGSVTIGQSEQGFIAVNGNSSGGSPTILRAESTVLSGDSRMGSITQKGSGSFAILLDADGFFAGRPDAKFVVESNSPIPGIGPRLFSISESMETRTYGHLKVDTNITASGNISASGTIITDTINVGNTQNVGSLNVGPSSNKIELKGGSSTLGSNPQILSTTGNIDVKDNLIISGNLDVTSDVSTKGKIICDDNDINSNSRIELNPSAVPSISLKGPINQDGQTVIKPESANPYGNSVGSITQKGSGSFEILLDADNFHAGTAYFGIRTNSALPGTIGNLLLTVSESFETRVHNGGLKADNYVTTTNITASGNISGSHVTTASFGSLQLSNLPTSPTGLPTGSVWVSGSKNDASTNNVNCGTLMIVI